MLNLSKSGKFLFRSMPNGNCVLSSASLSMVGDNSQVPEHRVMAAVELHVKCNILDPTTCIEVSLWKKPISNEQQVIFLLASKRRIKPWVRYPSSSFHKQDFIFSRIIRWIQWNYKISKNSMTLGSLKSKNWIWVIWAQKICKGISPEPKLPFSQTGGPNFLQNHNWIKSKLQILKSFWNLSKWSLKIIDFTWVQKFYQAKIPEP